MNEQNLTFVEWKERLEYHLFDNYQKPINVPTPVLRYWYTIGAPLVTVVHLLGGKVVTR